MSDLENNPLPGALIEEHKTNNSTHSNWDGIFKLQSLRDSTTIIIKYIGLDPQTFTIHNDTVLNVILQEESYSARWLSFGGYYEFINSTIGFHISNGYDELPILHFEDFHDNLIFKAYGQTNFNESYRYGVDLGISYLKYLGRTVLSASKLKFTQSAFSHENIGITSHFLYSGNTGLLGKVGYQKLNGKDYFGFGGGIERAGKHYYIGLNSRYYFSYFHHQAYLQYSIPGTNWLHLRVNFDLIDNKSILSCGLHYTFRRSNNS